MKALSNLVSYYMGSGMTALPTYHLPPNATTIAPPKGPFDLGTVLCDFDCREQMRPLRHGLQHASRVPIHNNDIFRDSRTAVVDGAPWSRLLPVRLDDSTGLPSIETTFFYPTPEYVAASLEQAAVAEYLRATMHKKAVFLVTGLKVARWTSTDVPLVVGIECLKIYRLGEPGLDDTVYTEGADFFSDESADEDRGKVHAKDLVLVGPDNYNNAHFAPHEFVVDGREEVWMLPVGADQ